MKLENANDIRVHHSTADAPLFMQDFFCLSVSHFVSSQEFQRDSRFTTAVIGEPHLGHAARAQLALERISIRQPRTFLKDPHK